jgi:hypothetical protein
MAVWGSGVVLQKNGVRHIDMAGGGRKRYGVDKTRVERGVGGGCSGRSQNGDFQMAAVVDTARTQG